MAHQLDTEQVSKAARALLKHVAKAKSDLTASGSKRKRNLLDDNDEDVTDNPLLGDAIYLQVSTLDTLVDRRKLKPKRVVVRNPVQNREAIECCLIVKDPADPIKEIIASSETLRELVPKVIGISKFKGKYGNFEAKRRLRDSYDVFLADERIGELLPRSLGSTFYQKGPKSKIPLTIQIQKTRPQPKSQKLKALLSTQPRRPAGQDYDVKTGPEKLELEIRKALQGVYINLAPGINTAVKVGHTGLNAQQLVENIEDIVGALVGSQGEVVGTPGQTFVDNALVPKGWNGLRGLYIKTPNSVALPIWLSESEPYQTEHDSTAKATTKENPKEKLLSKSTGKKTSKKVKA